MSLPFTDSIDMLTGSESSVSAGVTKTTVGDRIDVSKRQQITIQFVGKNLTGDGNFRIDASNDGTNWDTGIAVIDASGTATTTGTNNITISSANPNCDSVYVRPGYRYLRCNVDVDETGTFYAFLQAAG
jgi:hypothetical protein